MSKLRVLDLFSGIGGFSLGLHRTQGFDTVAFCEINPFCRKVLAKHWPEVPCYEDVQELTSERLAADGISIDAIVGGFPCQDISYAGDGAGLAGKRSGLFYEVARLVRELEPRFVVLENVSALLDRGLGDVLGTLASLGYDAEWHCIPASYVGAWHRRDRIWVVAYPCRAGRQQGRPKEPLLGQSSLSGTAPRVAQGWPGRSNLPTPRLHRAGDGLPDRAHRTHALGNAVVPQIPELIGHAILASLANNQAEAA
jgi:DNA (cytosine-5)-methyltransferase 1